MKKILRSEYVQFQATVPEARLLGMLSMHLGLNRSQTLRRLIREAAGRLEMPDPQEMFEKKEVTHDVKKVE
jgi:hypothetical protein